LMGFPVVKQMTGQQPIAKYKAGQVTAALWENDINTNGQKVQILKASVQRRFKDRDGTWKSSMSFSRNEIPLAVFCLQKCFEYIVETQNKKVSDNGSIEEEFVM